MKLNDILNNQSSSQQEEEDEEIFANQIQQFFSDPNKLVLSEPVDPNIFISELMRK